MLLICAGDAVVQRATAVYLERQLGWGSVYARNGDDYCPDSFFAWPSDGNVLLTRALREKLPTLLKFVQEIEREEGRALREGLGEESLAVFDLLKKPDLGWPEIERIKRVAKDLLQTLKAEKLRVDQWSEKDATQSAVKVAIHDFLYSDETGLPATAYWVDDLATTSEAVFAHVYRAYPTVPSPCYDGTAAA